MLNLKALEISEKEQLIYTALLNNGILNARELSQLIDLNRSTTYLHLEQLTQKGLVTEITDQKKKYFQAVNPKGLKKVIGNKIDQLKKLETDLPELIKKYKSSSKKRTSTSSKVFKGITGIQDLVEEIANSNLDVYFLGSIKSLQQHLPFDFLEKIYTKPRRRNLKTTDYLISDWAASTIRRFHEERGLFSKIRFLPPDVEPKGCFVVFGNKLIVGQLNPGLNAVIIEEPTIASMFKLAFSTLWKDLDGKYIPPYQP